MPLAEAVERAGSIEALLPHLCDARILARHGGLYASDGVPKPRADDRIPAQWWANARDVDPATGRAHFTEDPFFLIGPHPEADTLAIGIELERAVVERLFPAALGPAPRHAGGRDPVNDWEGAAGHVTSWVKGRGPLPRRKNGEPLRARAVDLMTEWFEKNEPPAPPPRSIYRWLRNNPHREWWGL